MLSLFRRKFHKTNKVVKTALEKKEDDDQEASLSEFVKNQFNKFFIDHIPIDSFKELPPTYMYYFGTVAHIVALVLFIGFTVTNYQSAISQKYISLQYSQGCSSVPISVGGTFLVDTNGLWQGAPDFQYSLAEYSLTLNNYTVQTSSDYVFMIDRFQKNLDHVSNHTENFDLSYNLLYWMNYIIYFFPEKPDLTDFSSIGFGSLQYFQLSGDPLEVFELMNIQSQISSEYGVCPLGSFAAFDRSTGIMTGVYSNSTQFSENEICFKSAYPPTLGYNIEIDNEIFDFKLEVRSFSTALAVNMGIVQLSDLIQVQDLYTTFTAKDGVNYSLAEYFDVRFNDMLPVQCIRNQSALPPGTSGTRRDLCFNLIGTTLALPVFNHIGNSDSVAEFCNCSTVGSSERCQSFNFLNSLVFYRNAKNPETAFRPNQLFQNLRELGLFVLLEVITQYETYFDFNRAAYNASFAAAAGAYGSASPEMSSASWLQEAYKFCYLSGYGGSCSLITFNPFDNADRLVSDYKLAVLKGSCANTLQISDSSCAVGIAAGNTQLFLPILVMSLLPFLYFLLVIIKQVPPKEEYPEEEKKQALEILSILLLRLRDGKTRGIRKKGLIETLAKEMIIAAKDEGGYPDSDDEDDEYEEDEQINYSRRNTVRKSKYSKRDDEDDATENSENKLNEYSNRDDQSVRDSRASRRSTLGGKNISKNKSVVGQIEGLKNTKAGVVRRKMAVHIDARSEIEAASENERRNSAGRLSFRSRLSSARFSVTSPMNMVRKSMVSKDAMSRPSISSSQPNSIFGYLFGNTNTNNNSENNNEIENRNTQEMIPVHRESVFIDISNNIAPLDLRILNLMDDNNHVNHNKKFSKSISGDEIDTVVDDLLIYFGEVLSIKAA
eukprot:gene8682-11733_t